MATSTPLHPVVELHRTMANTAMSPLRRSTNTNNSALNMMEMPDDEQERSKRRQSLAMQRRKPNASVSVSSPIIDLAAAFNTKEVQEHLTYCTKLYNENKITAKNVWELRIIDILRQLATSEQENILLVGANALEIGAKVYGLRVDELHRRALQLAGELTSMDRKKAADGEEGEGEENDEEAGEGAENRRKKKQKTRVKKKTGNGTKSSIDYEAKHLFGMIRELEPVCFSTVEDFDVGSFDNLFTLKQPMNPATNRLVLLDKGLFIKHEKDIEKLPDEILPFGVPKTPHAKLCPSLHKFSVTEWDPEKNMDFEEVVFDDEGFPIAELDGSVADIFKDDHNSDDVEPMDVTEEERLRYQGDVANVVDAIPEESRRETEYGFNTLLKMGNGQILDKLWAGPSHWKIKYIKPMKARFSGSVHTETQKKQKRALIEPSMLDLDEMIEENKTLEFDLVPIAQPSVRTPADNNKVTLPKHTILQFDLNKHFLQSKLRTVLPRRLSSEERHTVEENDVANNNFDDLASDHISHASFGDNGIDDDDKDASMLPETDNAMDLVPEPEMVQCDYIAFARRAKKMDMYKLKASIWKILKEGTSDENDKITPMSFKEVYSRLPEFLNSQMKEDLSVHLAFVGTLDLCNAHSLKLIPTSIHNVDFTITNGQI